MKRVFLFSFICIFIFIACQSQNKIIKNDNKKNHPFCVTCINFGLGGGFTNSFQSYTLYSNGKLVGNGHILKQVSSESLVTIFNLADSIHESYIAPGNTYQFVNIISDSDSIYCSWQYGDQTIDTKITILYDKLKKIL